MKVAIRNRRLPYFTGGVVLYLALAEYHDTYPHPGTGPSLTFAVGLLTILQNAVPFAWIDSEALVLRRFIFPKRILLKDIVRIDSDPVQYSAFRKIILHEASGRKTVLYPPDPNKLVGLLSSLLPDSVPGRSTGYPAPPWGAEASPPWSLKAHTRFSLTAWMGMVYDAKTNEIRPRPEAGSPCSTPLSGV